MATDWARYMVERPDVYDVYRKSGHGFNWTWDRGRQHNEIRRNDGEVLQAETAAEYAANHYRNFGKSEGMQLHERTSDAYEQKLRQIDGGGGGGSALTADLAELIAQLAEVAMDPNATPEQIAEAAEQSRTILTDFGVDEQEKKKSFLTPIGGGN